MDLIRSAYSCPMRMTVGGPLVQVQWRFADASADLIGVPTAFGSANWNLLEPERFDAELGEQTGPRPWRNGQRPAGLTGKRLCFPVDWFTSGVPVGTVINQPVGQNLVPACCVQQEDRKGGVFVSGKTTLNPSCDCLVDLPDLLNVTFTGITGCGVIAGITTVTRNVGTCTWTGAIPAFLGVANFTVSFAAGTLTFTIDCFLGTESKTVSGSACSPLDVTFTVTDDQACCSFAGTDIYTVRVTS